MTYFLMIILSILFAILAMKYYQKGKNNITNKILFFLFAFLYLITSFSAS